jgi:tRNA pseudouridine38-40 synthase
LAEAFPHFPTQSLPAGQRLALRVEYDGSAFCGWQSQPHLESVATVQESVERALEAVAAAPVRVHCAGRTDTGVHATSQWIHFDAPASRSLKSWIVGGNAQLPETVRLTAGRAVPSTFHARHSALARQYDYLVANTPTASALLARRALWVRTGLDETRMHRAVQDLLGERDFSAFRAAACQSRTPMRFVSRAWVVRRGAYLQIRLVANAFLHHMVRNIVGSLIPIGLGEQPVDWLATLLEARDRTRAAPTAAPHGLYLTGVEYPEDFALPDAAALPMLVEHL